MKSIKISLLMGFILFYFVGNIKAQTKVGLLAGPSMSYQAVLEKNSTSNKNIENAAPIVGFHIGGFMTSNISEKIESELVIKFSQQGAAFDKSLTKSQIYRYIYAPLSINYYPVKKWSINVGTDLGFLIHTKRAPKDNIFDLGLHAGTSFNIIDDLSIGVRYMHGFSKVIEGTLTDENGAPDGEFSFRNRLFELSLKYTLHTFPDKK